MGKNKGTRITITLACSCQNYSNQSNIKNKRPIFRYTTTKNRRNTPNKLKLRKYCSRCNHHSIFQEIK